MVEDWYPLRRIPDLAVGAPYEQNGAVYIYLGGPDGLASKPSQIIYAPNPPEGVIVPQTFGQSLSKGADIDGNLYLGMAEKHFWL